MEFFRKKKKCNIHLEHPECYLKHLGQRMIVNEVKNKTKDEELEELDLSPTSVTKSLHDLNKPNHISELQMFSF